jgi:hypothetical protein
MRFLGPSKQRSTPALTRRSESCANWSHTPRQEFAALHGVNLEVNGKIYRQKPEVIRGRPGPSRGVLSSSSPGPLHYAGSVARRKVCSGLIARRPTLTEVGFLNTSLRHDIC